MSYCSYLQVVQAKYTHSNFKWKVETNFDLNDMRYILYFLILIVVISCKKDEPINYNGDNCIDNNADYKPIDIFNDNFNDYDLKFLNNSRLSITQNEDLIATILPGDKVVFQYKYYYQDTMPDSFRHEEIKFEIDSNIDNFIISDNNLKKASAIFFTSCFCEIIGNYWINDGCIKGEKLSNTAWQIDINIVVTTEYNSSHTKMISEKFTIKTE